MGNFISNADINIQSYHTKFNYYTYDTLLKLFLIFLPFGQVFTIDVLFPLKLSEVFLILMVVFQLISGNFLKISLSKPLTIIMISLIGLITVSLIVNIFWVYVYKFPPNIARFNPAIDSVLKFFYILMAFMAMLTVRNAFKKDENLIKYFFVGATISSAYAWYLFVFGVLRFPMILLPGTYELSKFHTSLGDIIRSSTFKEGNYMGFYLLVSATLAMYYKKAKLTFFYFITIITTFSSTAIACSLVFFVIYIFNHYKQYKLKVLSILIVFGSIIVLLVQFSSGFKSIFYDKIFGSEDNVESVNDLYSKADRLNTSAVALDIAINNPFLGVGPANYGLHYLHYNKLAIFDIDGKHIPNNIYVEVLSECGGVAFVVFIFLLYYVFKNANLKSSDVLVAGLIASYMYFFAFPTFTMLFIWVFLGIILA